MGHKQVLTFEAQADFNSLIKATRSLEQAFDKVALPAELQSSIDKTFTKLNSELKIFENLSSQGFDGLADVSKAQKSFGRIFDLISSLSAQAEKVGGLDPNKIVPKESLEKIKQIKKAWADFEKVTKTQTGIEKQVNEQSKAVKKQQQLVTDLETKYNSLQAATDEKKTRSLDLTQQLEEARGKAKEVAAEMQALEGKSGEKASYSRKAKEASELSAAIKGLEKDFRNVNTEIADNEAELKSQEVVLQAAKNSYNVLNTELKKLEKAKKAPEGIRELREEIHTLTGLDLKQIPNDLGKIEDILKNLDSEEAKKLSEHIVKIKNAATDTKAPLEGCSEGVRKLGDSGKEVARTQRELENFKNNILQFFSIGNAVQLFKRAVSSAIQTVKELDAVMTEIAVVSDFDIGDMWEKLPEFTDQANKLGVAVKDMYAATTLYIQQGLNMNDSMALSVETMKMARIAGLEAADATDAMTAALRGFNMELNETSAQNIADVYAKLAAITAADVNEISTAMTKTASIASNANMEFETTAAFLSQIIETTRESAETAGTAMKTVIARFQELKKDPSEIGEVDGEIVDANKIETALRSIGVSLRDTQGQFRDLDDVFLEIAKKWDGLDTNTQRYIATMAAGSRQQSRFIAMMSNYERTMELVSAANNSAGASQEQFEKTLKSLEAKLAKLKNAWDEFTTGIANNEFIKFGVDALTKLLELVNKLSSGTGDFGEALIKLGLGYGALKGGESLLRNLFAKISGVPVAKDVGAELGAKFVKGFKNKILNTKEYSSTLGKNFIGGLFKDTSNLGTSLSQILNNVELKPEGFKDLQKKLDGILGTLTPENWLAVVDLAELGEGFEANEASIRKYAEALEAAGADTSGLLDKNSAATTKMKTDWQSVGVAAAAAGMAISGFGRLLENSGYEKLGKAVSAIGAALTTVGTLMSVVIPMAADTMAKKTIASIMSIPYVREIALILAAITAVGTAVYTSITHAERETKALEERISALREAGKEAEKQYEEGLSSFKKYQELSDIYDDAIVGTQSWRESLIEVNDAALALLETFPELEKYIKYDGNGKISFTEGADEYFESLNKRAQNYSRATLGVEAYKTSNSFDNLRREKAGYSYNLEDSIEGLKEDIVQYQEWARQAREAGDEDIAKNYEDDIARFKEEIAEKERLLNIAMSPIATEEAQANREVESQVAGALVEGMSQEMQDSEFGYDLANAMARNVGAADYQEKIDIEISNLKGLGLAQPNYKKALKEEYGYTDEQVNKMNREERQREYATLKVLDELGEELKGFYENLKKLNKDQQKMAVRILKGSSGYSKAMADDVTKLFGTDGSYNQEQVAEWYKKTTGLSLEEAAANLGITVEEYIEQLRLDAEEAAVAFEEATSTLAKVGVSLERFDAYDISSSTLNAFADQIYGAFLDLGPEAARGLFNSFSSAIDQATPEQRDAVMAALAQVDLSSYEGIVGFTDQFEALAKSAGISSTQVEKLKGEMIALAGVAEQIDVEKLKESAKSLEDIGKRIEKDPTDYIFSGDDRQQLLDKGIASETDFIATGVDEWVYIGGSMESLLSSINTNVYGILGKMEVSNYAVERGAGWQEVVNKTPFLRLNGYQLVTTIGNLMEGLPSWSQENIESLNFEDLWDIGNQAGAFVNQDGSVTRKEDFNGNVTELASFLLARYNEYYGAGGLTYETNQAEYNKQLEQQAALKAQAEMISAMGKNAQYFLKDSNGDSKIDYTAEEITYLQAQARKLGIDSPLIERATDGQSHVIDLANAISNEQANLSLQKFSEQLLGVTEKYKGDFTNLSLNDIHEIGAMMGIDTYHEAYGADNQNFIRENIKNLSLGLQGDASSWFAFQDNLLKKLQDENYYGIEGSNIQDFIDAGIFKVYTEPYTQAGDQYLAPIYNKDGTKIIGYTSAEAKTSDPHQQLYFSGIDELIQATENPSAEVEDEKESDLLDKNFNILQKINAEQRKRIQLEREYEKLLKSENTTAEELSQNLNARIASLAAEGDIVQSLYNKEEESLKNALGEKNGVTLSQDASGEFIIEVDLEGLDEDGKKEALEYKDELQESIDLLNDYKGQLADIEKDVQDIANTGRDEYIGLEERLASALENIRQEELDAMREINDSINDAANDLMDAVQSNIDKMRQDRENEKTESEIAEKERRLAYLRQDTSGANAAEIKSLEKEIAQQKEGYGDTLIDQALSDMQKQNEEAAKQREEQLLKQQEAHDQMVENGGYAKDAADILAKALKDGNAFTKNSEFFNTLYKGENGGVLTDAAYEKWMEDLVYSVNSASVYNNSPLPKTTVPANYDVGVDNPQIMGKMLDIYRDKGRITKDILILNELRNQKITNNPDKFSESMKILTWYDLLSQLNRKYATGGIADFTGPAWLDGTKSHPELILNARDTENFILLKDALSKAVNGSLSGSSDNGGDNYFDITIEVEEIGNDYDVDQMVARIKQQIYEDSAYRNVNTINFLR